MTGHNQLTIMALAAICAVIAIFIVSPAGSYATKKFGFVPAISEEDELRRRHALAELGQFYGPPPTRHVYRTLPFTSQPPVIEAGGGFIGESKNIPARGILGVNSWSKRYEDGTSIVVWAGGEGSNTGPPTQGVLVVKTEDADGKWRTNNYWPDTQTGSLHVTDATDDGVLIVEAADGTVFHFDLSSRTFSIASS